METVTIQKNYPKTYPGGKEALKQLSLSLNLGEVFGFLGPNGAGKTTTVKTSYRSPYSIRRVPVISWALIPARNRKKAHLLSGIVTEHAQMYDNLTGMENLIFLCRCLWTGGQKKENSAASRCSEN